MKSPGDTDSFLSADGRVEVVFDLEDVELLADSDVSIVMQAAIAGLDSEQVEGPDHITVMITGDERIRELNREFKGEDEITDVLSFSTTVETAEGVDRDEWPAFPEIEDSPDSVTEDAARLGDIAISLPQVVRQAVENGKSTERELAMLTIHGVLHLLGYDHAEREEEKVMFGKTDVVLAEVFGD